VEEAADSVQNRDHHPNGGSRMATEHEQDALPIEFDRRPYSDGARQFRLAIRELFQRPREVRRTVVRDAWKDSPEIVVDVLREIPERFGRLTGNPNPFDASHVRDSVCYYLHHAISRCRYDLREAAARCCGK